MKRQSVRKAYESIHPDGKAKARMLENILSSTSEIAPAGKDDTMNRRKMKPVLIAAMIALMVILMGCAIVALNLGDMKIGEYKADSYSYYDNAGNKVTEPERIRDVISLQGMKDTPGQMAAKEWYEFRRTYDPDWSLMIEADQNGFKAPKEYDAYGVYTQEMIDKLDEIVNKYALKLAGECALVQAWENEIFFDALGLDSLLHTDTQAVVEYTSGYFYECGNFDFAFWMTLTDANWSHEVLVTMRYNDKAYLDTVVFAVDSVESMEQWNYTTADGTEVLIVMDESFARVFCDREDAFVSAFVDVGYEYDSGEVEYMSKADVEAVADALDFTVKPQKPDMDAAQSKIAEAEARWLAQQEANRGQDTYSGLIEGKLNTLEHPENLYYCLMDANEDGIEDLILGTKGEAETVWTIIDGCLSFAQMTDENWAEVDSSWTESVIKPITEFSVYEGRSLEEILASAG